MDSSSTIYTPSFWEAVEDGAFLLRRGKPIDEYVVKAAIGKAPALPDTPDFDTMQEYYSDVIEYTNSKNRFLEEALNLSKK